MLGSCHVLSGGLRLVAGDQEHVLPDRKSLGAEGHRIVGNYKDRKGEREGWCPGLLLCLNTMTKSNLGKKRLLAS